MKGSEETGGASSLVGSVNYTTGDLLCHLVESLESWRSLVLIDEHSSGYKSSCWQKNVRASTSLVPRYLTGGAQAVMVSPRRWARERSVMMLKGSTLIVTILTRPHLVHIIRVESRGPIIETITHVVACYEEEGYLFGFLHTHDGYPESKWSGTEGSDCCMSGS